MTLKNLEALLNGCHDNGAAKHAAIIAAARLDIAELKARSEAEVRHVQRSFLSVEAELTAERARHKACAKLAEEDLSAKNWEASYDKVCRERDEQKAVLAEATQLREPSAERVHTSRNHCIIIAELDCLRVEVARLHVLVDDETDARVRVEYELSAERARHAETMRESNDLHDELRALKDPARKAPGRPTVDELANAVCALRKRRALSDMSNELVAIELIAHLRSSRPAAEPMDHTRDAVRYATPPRAIRVLAEQVLVDPGDLEEPTCAHCGGGYTLDEGCEPASLCHPCVYEVAEALANYVLSGGQPAAETESKPAQPTHEAAPIGTPVLNFDGEVEIHSNGSGPVWSAPIGTPNLDALFTPSDPTKAGGR
jgi:hypothetical protein